MNRLASENEFSKKMEEEIIPLLNDYIKENISDYLNIYDFDIDVCNYGEYARITYTYNHYKLVIEIEIEQKEETVEYYIDTLCVYDKSYGKEKALY